MKLSAKYLLAVLILGGLAVPTPVPSVPAVPAGPVFTGMPLVFAANAGQIDDRASFYVAGKDKAVFFGPGGISIALAEHRGLPSTGAARETGSTGASVRRWSVRLGFAGADPAALPSGEDRTPAVFSYFKGRPEDWRTGVPTYSKLAYRGLWPGIDLVYSGTDGRLKYELVVSPGADPSAIRFTYTGATNVTLGGDGRLEVETPLGSFRDDAPSAYQDKDGKRIEIPAAFLLEENGENGRAWTYGFDVGEYDPALPLVIDPAILIYCGFIGGYNSDAAAAIARDADGYIFVTGSTESPNFPVDVGPDLTFNSYYSGPDAFVAKVNPQGTALVYCGFVGGSRGDLGSAIAVDLSGNAYLAGWTFSEDFPVLLGPGLSPHGNIAQNADGFVAKVNPLGTGLLYSGYVGGTSGDQVLGLAIDGSGNAYLAGWTESSDFPRLTGPDLTWNGARDAFVAKVNASGVGFAYSGFIGGSELDEGAAIAVDASGRAVVAGSTFSYPGQGFPVLTGPGLTFRGGSEAFVARVSAAGSGLDYCGYVGGNADDSGAAVALDGFGNAVIAGTTASQYQFPSVTGPDLSYSGGPSDAFVAKVNASGSGLEFCGYIGGTESDSANAVAVDPAGFVYVAGTTNSQTGFPVSGGPGLALTGWYDAFVVTVEPSGEGFFYGGYIGGSVDDEAMAVAADGRGNVWIAGYTASLDFPAVVGPYLLPGGGYGIVYDAFVARIFEDLPPLAPENLRASGATVSSVTLAWDDASENEDGFEVERKSGPAGTFSSIATLGAGVETYTDAGRPEATAYVYRVRAYNDLGDSAYSNEAAATTLSLAPTDLSAAAVNARRVELAWTDHSAGETGFKVQRRSSPAGEWAVVGTTGVNITSFADGTAREETAYDYRVFAVNAGGDSAPSNIATVTTPALTIPNPPSGLLASAASSFSVDLAWTDNSYDEDGFRIERKTGAGGTWAEVAATATDVTVYLDTGLSDETTYYYRVKAYNGAGESGYSNEAEVTTPEYRPRIRVPVADIAFGSVNICGVALMSTTIYNDGAAPLTVSAVTRKSGSAEWSYAYPAPPFAVPGGGSVAISVRFAPLETAAGAAAFTVVSDDPDNPAAAFATSGTGFLPAIGIALSAERRTERAWIVRRDYARITATVTKAAPFEVTTYRLSRREGSGIYMTVRDFTEGDFTAGVLVANDTFLASGTSYTYKMDALDCQGRIIASSSESGPTAPPPVPKARAKTLKRRQP